MRCRVPSTGLEWNPKKEVMILVLLTWALEAVTLCALRPMTPLPYYDNLLLLCWIAAGGCYTPSCLCIHSG